MGVVGVAAAVRSSRSPPRSSSLNGRLDDPHDLESAAFAKAQTQSTGRSSIALAPTNGVEVARVVLLPDGSGYLKNDNMKTLPSDETYQLWALTGDPSHPIAISAGVLGSEPEGRCVPPAGQVHGFALTVEHSPGVGRSRRSQLVRVGDGRLTAPRP